MVQRYIEKVHTGTLSHLCRRAVAFVLVTAMSLSFLPATSWAASASPITPTQVTDQNDFPKIEFQTNFVRTEYGTLTGLMELAIRVGPSGTKTETVEGKEVELPIPVDFQAIAATLQFNTALYTPISWQWAYNEDGTAPAEDLDLKKGVLSYYDVQLPAMKDDTIPGTGAIAQCGILPETQATAKGMSDDVVSGDQALLFFKAEAYGTAVTLTEMTTLAVIRFYVAPELMEHISIERDKTSFSPERGDYNYDVLFDGGKITDRNALDTSILKVFGTTTTPDTPDTPDTQADTLTLPAGFVSVGFAIDSDMANSHSPAGMALDYSSGRNEFYFVPAYDATKGTDSTTNDTLDDVTIYIRADGSTTTTPVSGAATAVDLVAPETDGDRVLAVGEGKDEGGNTIPTYSYLTNLIPAGNITFPVVSQLSFADHGDGRENMATILFYDWDDTLIGVLVVPRNDDARAIVNAYVRDNMIHPDLRFDEEGRKGKNAPELINTLTRLNTYRGKYPATAPMPDGATDATVDLDGTKYPLTNKLDYSFLTRPMVLTTSGTTSTGQLTSTWTQPVTGTEENEETYWDYEYPYIHGWVLVPDEDLTDVVYTHPENIWTTIGMGELGTYNGAANGGYRAMNGAPAVLTATGQEFEFANFNFYENKQEKGTVYAVKAVYEPGESLLASGLRYRMISEPYYNKLNAPAANAGGAYSVDVLFERATTEVNNVVRGVARIREPGVRQDTTTDLKWEEDEELGVDHNLTNATIREAYTSKSKTTYTKIDVSNTEEIPFSLTLSARQNKVDYYIKEMYNSNFVVGGARTENDNTRDKMATTIDNYNYLVSESDMTDEWYDVEYSVREGSYGFVLIGTLHQLMELATQCNNGQMDPNDLYTYITANTLADVNLRTNADGKDVETFVEVESMVEVILAAAQDAKDNHYGEVGYWSSNPDHDCAELTYHQLQWYVVDDYADDKLYNGSATLSSPEDADKRALKWCHLHDSCAAKASGKPRNWAELINAAQGKTTDIDNNPMDPKTVITLLTPSEVESIAHLRTDRNGTPFNAVDDFADAIIAAVNAGHTSWDAVQDYIIRGRADVAYAQANYWWYDGSTSVRLNNWNNLIATTQDVFNDVTLPDGTVGRRYAKLNQLQTAFSANSALDGDEADATWIMVTENLVKTDLAEKFDTFDDFRTAFIGALTALGTEASWFEVQYYILHKTDPADDPDAETDYAGYYWHNGGRKVTDVSSLLDAAQRANRGDTVSWDAFTYADLYTYPGLQFRKDFQGTQYTAAEFDTFKATILTIAAQSTNRTWNQVQYYLIHDNLGGTAVVNNEAQYYWWLNNGQGDAVDFSSVRDYSTGLTAFLDAAFRYEINGNAHAWDNLTTDIIKLARLIAGDNGATTFDTLGHFANTSAFLSAFNGLTVQAGAVAPSGNQAFVKPNDTTVTWQQVQYYLLHGKSFVDAGTAGAENYWWRTQDDLGDVKGPEEYFAELLVALQDVFDNEDTTAIDEWMRNVEQLNAVFVNWDGIPFTQDDADTYADVGYDFWVGELFNSGDFSSASEVSWYQIEYMLLNWCYSWMSDADTKDELESYGIEIPSWVPAPISMFMMMRAMAVDSTSAQIMTLTERVNSLNSQLEANPTKMKEYAAELDDLMTALGQLQALLNGTEVSAQPAEEPICTCGSMDDTHAEDCPFYQPSDEKLCTCGSEDDIHAEDCPLYITPEIPAEPTEVPEPTEPAESPEPVETPEPTEKAEPTESPESIETPEPTKTPATSETPEPSEEELPEPTVPGAETPEETTDLDNGDSFDDNIGKDDPSAVPTESPKPEGTLETMPEIIDPDTLEPEEPESDPEPADDGPDIPDDLPDPDPDPPEVDLPGGETEAIVEETLPPAGAFQTARTRSGPTVYRRLTTKIATLSRRSDTGQTKLWISAGGVKMKQLNIRRIISPPGQRGIPLLLRTDITERRRVL